MPEGVMRKTKDAAESFKARLDKNSARIMI